MLESRVLAGSIALLMIGAGAVITLNTKSQVANASWSPQVPIGSGSHPAPIFTRNPDPATPVLGSSRTRHPRPTTHPPTTTPPSTTTTPSTTPAPVPPPPVATQPVALVYRGPGGCAGCSEAVASLLQSSSYHFITRYIGPNESLKLVHSSFVGATLYAQPGGDGSVNQIDSYLGSVGKSEIKNFVAGGGRYLGFCLGAYEAGEDPGLGLLSPGDSREYVGSPGASTNTLNDTVIPVVWRGQTRQMFFQDGPYLLPSHKAGEHILATYTNGTVAAETEPYGKGRVGVVGPHPEADWSWYSTSLKAKDTDGLDTTQGFDLITDTMG